MKKYLLLFSIIVLGLSACKKGDVTAEQAVVDDAKIQAYMTANNITGMTKDPSGIYYKVIKTGTGGYPTASSSVQVAYTLKLLNGSTVETSSAATLVLANTIKGFQLGVPHINGGTPGMPATAGRLFLIIPSGLAYGTSASGTYIPANANLVYTIDLLGFTN